MATMVKLAAAARRLAPLALDVAVGALGGQEERLALAKSIFPIAVWREGGHDVGLEGLLEHGLRAREDIRHAVFDFAGQVVSSF